MASSWSERSVEGSPTTRVVLRRSPPSFAWCGLPSRVGTVHFQLAESSTPVVPPENKEWVHVLARYSFVVLALAALLTCGVSPAGADTTVTAQLRGSNNSGVTGTATLTATDDGGLRVVIHADGFVPDQPHAQHIHGAMTG